MNLQRHCKLFLPVPKQEAWEECDFKYGFLATRYSSSILLI